MWWKWQPTAPRPGVLPGWARTTCATNPASSPLLRTRQKPWRKHPRWFAELPWMISNEMSPAVKAHWSIIWYFWKWTPQSVQNAHSEQTQKNYSGICQPSTRTFQPTCAFSEVLERVASHQRMISSFTCNLKVNVNSLGTTLPKWTWIQSNTYLCFSEIGFSPSLQHKGPHPDKWQLWTGPTDHSWTMSWELLLLLQSAFLAMLFATLLPPADIYLVTFRLAWRCESHRSKRKWNGKGLWEIS